MEVLVCRRRAGTLSLRALTSPTQPALLSVAIWSRVFDVLRASAVVQGTALLTPEQSAGGAQGEGAWGAAQCGVGESSWGRNHGVFYGFRCRGWDIVRPE